MKDVKELPITLDIEFTVNLKNCLPLCMTSEKESLKNWVNENFILNYFAHRKTIAEILAIGWSRFVI